MALPKPGRYWEYRCKWNCPKCGYETFTSGNVYLKRCKKCGTRMDRKKIE